ncbi:hypothetical protein LAZ67_3006136 [Cordylochernes scorpioides]|uniref:Transposase n=1 Tax=Cordylochernes scorpioides TaxID=51811 RepID=A0ABY6KB58_9ARAC|nr:hypothetical protein LAZ67_3006136 [Cordylochernes scorpioides]
MAIFEEQRICIKFCFKLKKKSATETYELIKEAFGDAALSLTGLSVYLGIMRCLREAVRLKRPERWQNNDWILHVGNARPHTVHVVLQFLAKHSTIQIPHPPYSPDLAPNDFFLYPKLKINLKGRKFDNVDMIQAESKATLRNLSKSDFISCFDNWKKRWNGLIEANLRDMVVGYDSENGKVYLMVKATVERLEEKKKDGCKRREILTAALKASIVDISLFEGSEQYPDDYVNKGRRQTP